MVKNRVKARIVAQGFKEMEKLKSDSPMAMRESLKIVLAAICQEDFEQFALIDIRAAFLNSKIERDVYVIPPKDLRKVNLVWKLNKLIYRMNDASRGFWKLMRNKFKSLGMVSVPGDEALYIKKADGKKEAIIVTHVDDFQVASSTRFLEEMIEILTKDGMEISKIEKESFRFTGIDINRNKEKGEITLDMEDYAESIKEIEEIREAKDDKELTLYERKVLKKMTGKLSWLV